ncbi:MAG: polysaccharide deacetylase family protein [Sphingobacteriaceae bacterium]|nr:MAG: polysaccharide deacetylase family protein [Sphingobacteriaceae bacterium]
MNPNTLSHLKKVLLLALPVTFLNLTLTSCQFQSGTTAMTTGPTISKEKSLKTIVKPITNIKIASATEVLGRKQIPILCYHQIRNWKVSDSKSAKDYIVQENDFKRQLKMLADSGYHTILPDQLYQYLNEGTTLPEKAIMLTFDDTDLDQYTLAAPEMKKYGFKGVFFIMTVSLGRPKYMTKAQVKELSDDGNEIASHTWDHHNVKKYQGEDWVTQIDKPTKKLQEITGKPVKYFAYPFGLWNVQAIPELKKRGFVAAFQLSEKRDSADPLFTIRRLLASGYWSAHTLSNNIRQSF